MELALKKLDETWARVEFQFHQHKDYPVYTTKMAEDDFEVGGQQRAGSRGGAWDVHSAGIRSPLTTPSSSPLTLPFTLLHTHSHTQPALSPACTRRCWRTTRCRCRA
jgi:hypothetical protein